MPEKCKDCVDCLQGPGGFFYCAKITVTKNLEKFFHVDENAEPPAECPLREKE